MMRKFLSLLFMMLMCIGMSAQSYIYKISLLSLDEVAVNTDIPVVIYAGGSGGFQSFLKDNTTNYTHNNGTYEAEIKNGTIDRAAWVFTLRKAEDGTITLKDSHGKYLAKNSSGSKANVAGTESNQDVASFTCTLQDETNKKYRLSYNIDETTYRVVRNAGPIALDPSGENWVDAQFYTFCATDFAMPFKVSESVENATWYSVSQVSGTTCFWQIANGTAEDANLGRSTAAIYPNNADEYAFCFIPTANSNEFKIYNKATNFGPKVTAVYDHAKVKVGAEPTTVSLSKNGSNYYIYDTQAGIHNTLCSYSKNDDYIAISAAGSRTNYSGAIPTFNEYKTYNVTITGAADGALVINGQEYAGGSILVPTISNIATYASAKLLAGYSTSVSLNNNTITVTYIPGRNVTFNITATNSEGYQISWSETKLVSNEITDASVVLAGLSYEFFSDFTITDEDKTIGDEDKTFTVTATHNLPMVPGKFYQIKCSKGYLSYVDNSNVSVKAATNNTDSKNLWYIKQSSANAPVFSLCNVESGKAVHGTSNGNGACESIEEFAYEMYDATNGQFGLVEPGTNQNLGAHGNYPANSANGGLGRWPSGHEGTAYTAEIFDLVFPTQEFANYVGGYASPSYYTALEAYNLDNTNAAKLKAVLSAYNDLETIELTTNKYYRLRNVGSIAEEASDNKYPYSWLTSTLSDRSGSNRMTMNHDVIPGADAIFYYNGNNLVSYNTGLYASGNTISEQAYDWTIEEGENRKFYLKNGSDYLTYWGYDDNGGQVNRDALMKSTKEDWAAWYLQEVPMYSVSINDFEATVQTEDGVQIKNGGKLYVAADAELTATDAKQWYTSKITKNDAAKTVTVTYSDPSGYYFIKDSEGNYATNNFEPENETAFGTKVNAYNGMWKATFDEDTHTVTINSGVGTPLYVDGNTYNVLTLTAQNDNGTFTAITEGDDEWTLEPVAFANGVAPHDISVTGGEETTYLTYTDPNDNNLKAYNGGFFVAKKSNFGENGSTYSRLSATDVDGKDKSMKVTGHHTIEVFYIGSDDIVKLEEELAKVAPLLLNKEIGYPSEGEDYTDQNYNYWMVAYMWGNGITVDNYAEFAAALNYIHNTTEVNLPTAGGFYNLIDNAGNSKTYYLTENSELLSYDNGLFTKVGVNVDGAFVDYANAGTTEGENFEFSKSTAGFGKLAVWQIGEGPLPSGDGRINSGWSITKQPAPAIKMNSVDDAEYYSTLYMPQPVIMPEGVTAYSAKINGTQIVLTPVAGPGEKLAAYTPVILSGAAAKNAITVAVDDTDAKAAVNNDLEGTITTMPQDPAYKYYTLSGENNKVGFYKYKSTKNLNGFKVYYKVSLGDAQAESNGFEFVKDNELTGIETTTVDSAAAIIYDLQGNKITNPIKGQIYIQNGKAIKY